MVRRGMHAISTPSAPAAIGPYSQAIRAGALLFVSGQIPLDPATGALVSGDITQQAMRVLDNLRAILRAAGGDLSSDVRTTIFLLDMGDFQVDNEIYRKAVGSPPPARATVQVAGLPLGARIEIDAIAYLG